MTEEDPSLRAGLDEPVSPPRAPCFSHSNHLHSSGCRALDIRNDPEERGLGMVCGAICRLDHCMEVETLNLQEPLRLGGGGGGDKRRRS